MKTTSGFRSNSIYFLPLKKEHIALVNTLHAYPEVARYNTIGVPKDLVLVEVIVMLVVSVVPSLVVSVTTVVGGGIMVWGVSSSSAVVLLSFLQAKNTQQRNKNE